MDVVGVCWMGGCVSVGCVGGLWVRMVGFVCMVVWFEVVYGWGWGWMRVRVDDLQWPAMTGHLPTT